jgi:hypothetical protein
MRKLPNRPSFTVTEKLVGYFICGVFALILWAIAYWVWWVAYKWFIWVTEPMQLLTVLVLPLPFLVYRAVFSPDRPVRPVAPLPMPSPGGVPPAEPPPRSYLPGLGWLYWLGNGELHRGTMVVLVVLFWSLFYWNWSIVDAMVQRGEGVLAFSFWGLITIFGTIVIRSVFSRIPGAEVSGPGDSKSKHR